MIILRVSPSSSSVVGSPATRVRRTTGFCGLYFGVVEASAAMCDLSCHANNCSSVSRNTNGAVMYRVIAQGVDADVMYVGFGCWSLGAVS
jgi:hypothetical protein